MLLGSMICFIVSSCPQEHRLTRVVLLDIPATKGQEFSVKVCPIIESGRYMSLQVNVDRQRAATYNVPPEHDGLECECRGWQSTSNSLQRFAFGDIDIDGASYVQPIGETTDTIIVAQNLTQTWIPITRSSSSTVASKSPSTAPTLLATAASYLTTSHPYFPVRFIQIQRQRDSWASPSRPVRRKSLHPSRQPLRSLLARLAQRCTSRGCSIALLVCLLLKD